MQEPEPPLSGALLQAYRNAEYHVFDSPGFVLQIGVFSEPLQHIYRRNNIVCAAFLTACNPQSRPLTAEENLPRQHRLQQTLQQYDFIWLPGSGRDPQEKWCAEDSLLVLGIDRDTACDIGRQFRQNAMVWCGENAIPELVILA